MNMPAPFNVRVECAACPIKERAVCARCDDLELQELNSMKFYKSIPARQVIALRGDDFDTVATLVSGTAKLTRTMEDGRTQMVGLLLPSDFIGRPGRATAQYDVTAVSDLTLCCFHRKPFEEMIARTPHLKERLLEMALDELDAARDWMLLLGRKSARERIASFLALIDRRTGRHDPAGPRRSAKIELPVTRETMADYLGLTIETVSRQFSQLRKDGIIQLHGTRIVEIPDLERLWPETGDDDSPYMS